MNCDRIKEKIDLFIFEQTKQLGAEISIHTESCESCQSYFTESMESKKIMEQMQRDPVLSDPEGLSSSIMDIVNETDQISKSKISNTKTFRLIKLSLAAASISLMIIFGIEEYILFDKISTLEEYVSAISTDERNISFSTLIHFNLGIQPESFNKLLTEELLNPGHLNLKSRLIRTRLSGIALNNLDSQKINQAMQVLLAREITKHK